MRPYSTNAVSLSPVLFALAILFLGPPPSVRAQVELFAETFNDDSGFTKLDGTEAATTFFSDGTDSYFGIGDGSSTGDFDGDAGPTGGHPYDAVDNTFLMTESLGSGGAVPFTLLWEDIEIADHLELEISANLASVGSNHLAAFEPGDFLQIEVSLDDGSFETVLDVRSDGTGRLRLDIDGDGIGDTIAVNSIFTTVSAVVGTGTSLDLRLSIFSDDAAEDLAVDDLRIVGTPLDEWVAGNDDFHAADNWSLGRVPTATDRALVRNGGTVVADAGPSLDLYDLFIGELEGSGVVVVTGLDVAVAEDIRVGGAGELTGPPSTGSFTGLSGMLWISGSSSVVVGDSLHVGETSADGDATIGASSSLLLEDVSLLSVVDDLEIGGAQPSGEATVSSTVEAALVGIDMLTVGDDLHVAEAGPGNDPSTGTATTTEAVTLLVEDVPSFVVGEDLEIGLGSAVVGSRSTTSVDATFQNVALEVVDDLVVVSGTRQGVGSEASRNDFDVEVLFESSTVLVGASTTVHGLLLSEDAISDSTVLVQLVDTTWISTGADTVSVGVLEGDGGAAANRMVTDLELSASSMDLAGTLVVGGRGLGAAGALETTLRLDDASYLNTPELELDGEAEVRIHLDGTASVTTGSVGDPDGYSVLEADLATLAGPVTAIFDFVPASGTHTFDLILTSGTGTVDDTFATFTVEDLDPGFAVDSFGVVEDGGIDRLRLVVSGSPAEADLSISVDDSVDTVVAGTTTTYSVQVANVGPTTEPAAVVTDVFPAAQTCSWTSVASGGATGNGSGSDDTALGETLALPAGSAVTYTLICDVASSAETEIVHTASVLGTLVDPTPENAESTDTDNVTRLADLGITKDDGEIAAAAGDLLVYVLSVANAGPSDAGVATVTDLFPSSLAACEWECVPQGDAACSATRTSGDLVDGAFLPAGSSLTYLAGCIVDPGLDPSTLEITNTATVSAPIGVVDPVAANDTATDVDAGPGAVLLIDGFESGNTTAWSAAQ